MKIKETIFFILIATFAVFSQTLAGGGEANPDLKTNRKSLEKWKDLRFGMFIHWGPVALRGTEIGWSRGKEVPFEEYDQLYKEFNPVLFNAEEWVSIAKEAGMKYLILVTKHHDGFSLWDSDFTDYDIMASPFSRDIVWELADECKKQGLLFGTYYSILDWYHRDYPLKFRRGKQKIRKGNPDMKSYLEFLQNQIKELVEEYGTQILWFDGEWEEPWTHEMGMTLYKFGRSLNPEILINNRVDKGREGMEGVSRSARFAGDFETPEQRIGRFNLKTPWESCITICKQWAWKPNDQLKSLEECIHTLVRTAGGDGNLLLNVGPMLDGRIEQRQIDRLKEIGRWLEQHGETIYKTRGGPIEPQEWGVTTQIGDKIFVHVLNQNKKAIGLNKNGIKIKSAKLFKNKRDVNFENQKSGCRIMLPQGYENEIDLVLELKRY